MHRCRNGIVTNGEQGSLDKFQEWGSGGPCASSLSAASTTWDFVGGAHWHARSRCRPDGRGDGLCWWQRVSDYDAGKLEVSRRYLVEIADGLVPALQRLEG